MRICKTQPTECFSILKIIFQELLSSWTEKNDWCNYLKIRNNHLHFIFCSVRKNASELRISLEKVVVPIFCTASAGIEEDKKHKLDKVHTVQKTQRHFLFKLEALYFLFHLWIMMLCPTGTGKRIKEKFLGQISTPIVICQRLL